MEALYWKETMILRTVTVLFFVSSISAQTTSSDVLSSASTSDLSPSATDKKPPSITVIVPKPDITKDKSGIKPVEGSPTLTQASTGTATTTSPAATMDSVVSEMNSISATSTTFRTTLPPTEGTKDGKALSKEFVVSFNPDEEITLRTTVEPISPASVTEQDVLSASSPDVALHSSQDSVPDPSASATSEFYSTQSDSLAVPITTTVIPQPSRVQSTSSVISSLSSDDITLASRLEQNISVEQIAPSSALNSMMISPDVILPTQSVTSNSFILSSVAEVEGLTPVLMSSGLKTTIQISATVELRSEATAKFLRTQIHTTPQDSVLYENAYIYSSLEHQESELNTKLPILPTLPADMVTSMVVMATETSTVSTVTMERSHDQSAVMSDKITPTPLTSLSSLINPSPTMMVDMVTTIEMNETSTEATTSAALPVVYQIQTKLTFSGNCSVLEGLKAQDDLEEFRFNLLMTLSEKLNFPSRQIHLESTLCGSIIAVVNFVNVTDRDRLLEALKDLPSGREMFTASNNSYSFVLVGHEVIGEGELVQGNGIDVDSDKRKPKPLTQVQIIVIIVCSVVGGTLIIYAIGFCFYACYQKKKTKSFDLGETPGINMDLEDFTLTKMQRPPLKYTDHGVMAANGKAKKYKKNGNYQPIEDEIQGAGTEDIHSASTLPRRSHGVIEDGNQSPTVDQPVINTAPATDGAYDNRSFSSDDMLDIPPNQERAPHADLQSAATTPTHNGTAHTMTKEGATAF